MKKLIMIVSWMMAVLPLAAQDARSLLEKAEQQFLQSTGVEATFSLRLVSEGITQLGQIDLKGKKFKLQSDGVTTWFDGKTQWTYVQANEEVNVSEPEEVELEAINPYTFISLYKQGYTLKMGPAEQAVGRPVYEVDMLAEKKSQTIWQVVLMLDKQTYQPVQIKIRQRFDKWFILNVTSYITKQFEDSHFTFNKSDAPNAEIIDLR